MATLDVSDAFDTSFWTAVQLRTVTRQLDAEGVWYDGAVEVEPLQAVVIPGTTVPTHAEANNYIISSITIYTKVPLPVPTPTEAPAYIIYQNKLYRIDAVNDFGIYGAGFYSAICTLDNASNG